MPNGRRPPAVLTIAGSDASGGAGIQADLKTFTALGCYGASVITALTAQNTMGVQGVHAPPVEFIEQQLCSILNDDIPLHAIKTGMLYDADTIQTVIRTLKTHYTTTQLPPIICDPVSVSTSGHELLQKDAIKILLDELFPAAALITPNKAEAEALLVALGEPMEINNVEDMLKAAQRLLERSGSASVLLKGGHVTARQPDVQHLLKMTRDLKIIRDGGLPGPNMEVLSPAEGNMDNLELVVDVLCEKDRKTLFLRPRIDSTSTHGTGCTLSAAIACALASGSSMAEAIQTATNYTHHSIANAFPLGKGFGPLNHVHSFIPRLIPQPSSNNPHPLTRYLISASAEVWKQYVEHDFVKQLGRGTLPKESFIHFIKQDYHYLKYYARAHGLLAAKAPTFMAIGGAAETISNVVRECATHKAFCASWGVSEDELENAIESPATTAYGAYLIDTGMQGDHTRLVMALAACLLGYGEVGLWLKKESQKVNTWVVREGNPYTKWMDDYSSEWYQNAVRVGLAAIEECATVDPPSEARLKEWTSVWEKCTRFEKAFWDMGLNLS